MRRISIRELSKYPEGELQEILDISSSDIKKLVDLHILKEVKQIKKTEDKGKELEFDFVGLIIVKDLVVVSFPKYFQNRVPSIDEVVLLIRILRNEVIEETIANIRNNDAVNGDKLSIMLTLLNLYEEHGIYQELLKSHEINGYGEIDWARTISRHLPWIKNHRPYYFECETRCLEIDKNNIVSELHKCILTEISHELFSSSLGDMLSLRELNLTNKTIDNLGNTKELLNILKHERSTQFIDWKIRTLDLSIIYLSKYTSDQTSEPFQTLGTTSFYSIWEKACKVAFDDQLNEKISKFNLCTKCDCGHNEPTFKSIIPRPKWRRYSSGTDEKIDEETSTFKPDIVKIESTDNNGRNFCIYDAKYSTPTEFGKMEHQPGLESITKQFLYQSAYREFITENHFDKVANVFLVPTEKDKPSLLARVSFSEVMEKMDKPFSNFIYMWALPAKEIFECYLYNHPLKKKLTKKIANSDEYFTN